MTRKRTESCIEQHHTSLTPTWGVALPPLFFSISPYDTWPQVLLSWLIVIGCESLLYIFSLSLLICPIYKSCQFLLLYIFICRSRIFVSEIGGQWRIHEKINEIEPPTDNVNNGLISKAFFPASWKMPNWSVWWKSCFGFGFIIHVLAVYVQNLGGVDNAKCIYFMMPERHTIALNALIL